MEWSCIRQSAIPGTTELFADYLYEFDRVSGFYPSHFSDSEALPEAVSKLSYPTSRRSRMTSALRDQNGDCPAIRKLQESQTVAVVTGQQVGLFSGPAYTVFKALTAIKLAANLNSQGIPAVPVFWLATEDHDLAEVDHAWVFNHQVQPKKVALRNTISNGGPVGEVKIGELPLTELREALGDLPFADEVLKRIDTAYQPDATLGSSFRIFLQDLLKDFGLLFLDPLASSIREIAAPFLEEASHQIPDLLHALRQRDGELRKAGYHSQVHVEEDTSLLFVISEGKRLPIRWKDGRFVAGDRSYDVSDLQARAEFLSPNALLRPVMQDYLLPTVSYVGGPSEIAYMAQSQVLYEKLLGRMPVIWPRNSFTLLDTRATKLLKRYELHVPDLLDHSENVRGRIAARLVPEKLCSDFTSARSAVSSSLEDLESKLIDFDPTLAAAAKKSAAKILHQVDKLSRKTARETMRRDDRAAQDAAYLMNLVYPDRRLQERLYSIVPFLAKFGLDLPERLLAQTQLGCPDHMVRTF